MLNHLGVLQIYKQFNWRAGVGQGLAKGQLNSEWIYEVIVSPKMQTKNDKDFCPTKPTRIVATPGEFLVSLGSFFGYDPCLFGRAEILVI